MSNTVEQADLSALARLIVESQAAFETTLKGKDYGAKLSASARTVALIDAWEALTGLAGSDAQRAAENHANRRVVAYVPPFAAPDDPVSAAAATLSANPWRA